MNGELETEQSFTWFQKGMIAQNVHKQPFLRQNPWNLYHFKYGKGMTGNAFTCNKRGDSIVNAVTGINYYLGHKVGSKYEQLYFTVRIPGESVDLFYDSPSEFEQHFQIKLRELTKQAWVLKHKAFHQQLKQEM